jgi:WD40 repeat protein
MRFLKILFLFSIVQLFIQPVLHSQQAQTAFGKNRIQRKDFNWQYLSTLNFDIYYYDGGQDIARAAAHYAEADLRGIEDKAGFSSYTKIKILVYNSVDDLQQSNIGLEDHEPVVGGQTHFVKSKIEVAFEGSHFKLRKDIKFSVAEMIINEMLYGGSLKDIVQSSYLLSLPEWYVKGAAAYIAEGWSEDMDNYVREMFLSGKIKKPSHLTGEKAVFTGQSLWNFINEKYGKSNMGSILNLTRVMRNEEASIESTLGIPYSVFMREWKSYYLAMSSEMKNNYEEFSENAVIEKNRKDQSLSNIQISPEGRYVSYIKSYKGKFSLILYNTVRKDKKILYKTGQRLIHAKEDPLKLSHAWQSEDRLAFIEKRKGRCFLVFVEPGKNRKVRKQLRDFNQVLSFSFSPDGNTVVLSADKGGQSDLFIYDFKTETYRQITNDLFDDLDPVFLKNNQQIAFSSNRISDTLNIQTGRYDASKNNFNIFIYDANAPKKNILFRITESGNNTIPQYAGEEKVLFLSDETGIKNLFRYDLRTGSKEMVSRFLFGMKDYSYSQAGGLTFISLRNTKEVPVVFPEFKPSVTVNIGMTERQRIIDEANPVTRKTVDTSAFYFGSKLEEEEIDINKFIFESDLKRIKKEEKEAQSLLPAKQEDQIKIEGSFPYRNLFGVERVNSTLMIDPLRGLGVLMEADMSDMMGNHRMKAGLFGLTDLKSSSVFGEYWFLKKRVDIGVRYDRKTIYSFNETVAHRYTLNRGFLTFSYPLTASMRVSVSPFINATRFTDLNYFAAADNVVEYKGIKAEWVYDNTVVKGMNMIEGTRFRLSLDQFLADDRSKNFGKLIFDLRHYQSIHRELILATRVSYGNFIGNAPKNFLLGGMDNWLFNSTIKQGLDDPLNISLQTDNSDILFVEYVTNMRGFRYNTQYGPKYGLLNAELRIPLIRYLYNGVIHSNFLKNFQIAAFTDVGSAWSGKSPFNRDNSTNTVYVGGGTSPFTAKVVNYRNPFLVGYGAGIRTLFLGYYMKLDLAWGMVNYKVANRILYLTLGYDF